MNVPQYHVEHLGEPATDERGIGVTRVPADDLTRVFLADWARVERVRLAPKARLEPRALDTTEVLVYVTAGDGQATLLDGAHAVREGSALTLFMGERFGLAAGDAGLGVFLVELAIRPKE